MNDKYLYFLLDIIQKNGDARRLVAEGLSFMDISELTHSALSKGFLQVDENRKLSLTATGRDKYQADGRKFKKTDKNSWIQPQIKSRTSKIDKNDIFLPSQDELRF